MPNVVTISSFAASPHGPSHIPSSLANGFRRGHCQHANAARRRNPEKKLGDLCLHCSHGLERIRSHLDEKRANRTCGDDPVPCTVWRQNIHSGCKRGSTLVRVVSVPTSNDQVAASCRSVVARCSDFEFPASSRPTGVRRRKTE
jgi:hypothetical protein